MSSSDQIQSALEKLQDALKVKGSSGVSTLASASASASASATSPLIVALRKNYLWVIISVVLILWFLFK